MSTRTYICMSGDFDRDVVVTCRPTLSDIQISNIVVVLDLNTGKSKIIKNRYGPQTEENELEKDLSFQ